MARPYVHQRDGVVWPTARCVQIATLLQPRMLNEGKTWKVVVLAVDGTLHEVTRTLSSRVPHGRHHVRLTRERARDNGDGADVM